MKISYAITVCSEHLELEQLLAQLNKFVIRDEKFEIVILKDLNNSTEEVQKVITKYAELLPIKVFEHALKKNFSAHKNFLNSKCKMDYIFNIDADEIPSSILLKEIHTILSSNLSKDAWLVPRINIVKGLTVGHIKKWGWAIDDRGYVNWPDFQIRVYKNNKEIKWEGNVHERPNGYSQLGTLPINDKYALLHVKGIEKQELQNLTYEQIQKIS